MLRFVKRTSKKAGLSPGVLVHIGEKRALQARISLIHYDGEQMEERQLPAVEDVFPYKDAPPVTWINIDGLHETEIIEKIGHRFGLHPLVLEDIVNTGQRPKAEDFEHYLYIVLKMLSYDEAAGHIAAEQVSLVLSRHFLMSFQEREGDVLNPLRERIRRGKGRIRKAGCDYLAYAVLDAVVDHYFLVLEKIGERMEVLEEELLDDPGPETLQQIHHLKREALFMRKQVLPLREVVGYLLNDESGMIEEITQVFLRDVHDHVIQVFDTLESLRDVLTGLQDLYLSTASNRMNEVMKFLTIIATIFIPLTFVAGIYGMNFKYMPELDWKWSYPALWLVLIGLFGLMILFFKRRKWL
jgi:magnesium transporter